MIASEIACLLQTILLMHMDPDITKVGSERANNIHFHPPNYDGSIFLGFNSKTSKIFDPAGRPSDADKLFDGLRVVCDGETAHA